MPSSASDIARPLRNATLREVAKLEALEDSLGLAEAHREAAKVESFLGRTEQADRSFEQAVRHARLCGNRRVESEALLWRLGLQCWGYLPVAAGLRVTGELLERGEGGLAEAFALLARGRYRALGGDVRGGRADVENGRALIRDLGVAFYAAGSGLEHGEFELQAGEPAAAEVVLRETYEALGAFGAGTISTSAAALLGRALLEQGKLDEADEMATIAGDTALPDDVIPQVESRSVRARVRARRGDAVGAE